MFSVTASFTAVRGMAMELEFTNHIGTDHHAMTRKHVLELRTIRDANVTKGRERLSLLCNAATAQDCCVPTVLAKTERNWRYLRYYRLIGKLTWSPISCSSVHLQATYSPNIPSQRLHHILQLFPHSFCSFNDSRNVAEIEIIVEK